MPFKSEWSKFESFEEYGTYFLEKAMSYYTSGRFKSDFMTVQKFLKRKMEK